MGDESKTGTYEGTLGRLFGYISMEMHIWGKNRAADRKFGTERRAIKGVTVVRGIYRTGKIFIEGRN